jgi:hypothetical protein
MTEIIEKMARACAAVTADDMDDPQVSCVDWDRVRAALRAAEESGYILVPSNPTVSMLRQGNMLCGDSERVWRAMVSKVT